MTLLMRPNPTAVLLAAVGLAVAVLASLVVLLLNDVDPTLLLSFAGPLVVGLFVAAKVDAVTLGQNQQLDSHSQQLATISKNTNGVLDLRIRDGVRDVLVEAGVITPPAAAVPAQVAYPPPQV